MAETGLGEARFEIGAVISRAFEAMGSNFLLFFGLSLVLAGLPAFILEYWQATQIDMTGNLADGSYFFSSGYWSAIGVSVIVSMVTGAILQSALTRATVMSLAGEKPQFVPCLMVGLTLLLPMIAIGLIEGIALFVGFMLLVVPGVILWLVWSVVTPAYVQEKIGIFEAFGRSVELTSGSRWRIFLTVLIMVVLLWVLSIPVGFVVSAVTLTGNAVLVALIGAAVAALRSMIMVTLVASIYVELRKLKEGIAPAELEAIFA
ncbi:hypothetical protein P6144_02715 [Sphingomonas sp. HITSZ_GF]|uniref:hypothetical protein n=1 Tax=Sphingomonas sp. HITSZ_GF TaxID=3037247 RepID=UPI00240E8F0B|nr:hypothetical protein [Sphingomonas sp. HITSZ_GF]MDG2532547.1 hypothetical protein [Sphingomonas sp. HITSZ_GF]